MKFFVVTGGARGIGSKIVSNLSQSQTNKVFYCYRTSPNEEFLKAENVFGFQADCSMRDGCAAFSDFIYSKTDSIDGLINNVGVAKFELLNNTSFKSWSSMVDTNLNSVLYMSQFLLPAIEKRKGVIINLSSIVHKLPVKGTGAYATTKAMLSHLSQVMADEFAENNIEVVSLSPGFIMTETLNKPEYRDIAQENLSKIPLNQYGLPQDISCVIESLLSGELKVKSGSTIDITGGQHL